jgi:hypothetical protein
MAVLYDKSLDQIYHHGWTFNPSFYLPLPSTNWQSLSWGAIQTSGTQQWRVLSVPELRYSHFDSSVYPRYAYYPRYYAGSVRLRGARPMMAKATALNAAVDEVAIGAIGALDVAGNDEADVELMKAKEEIAFGAQKAKTADTGVQSADVQVRENLDETAFCYPMLQTDSTGQVVLRFTLPESLTTWRFMGVSNTPDMMYGYIGAEAVAKKDVMIQPNVPRFLRQGDEATVSARIFNTTDRAVSGMARLQLIDPETGATVCEQQQPFAADAEKSASVCFTVDVSQRSTFNTQHSTVSSSSVRSSPRATASRTANSTTCPSCPTANT